MKKLTPLFIIGLTSTFALSQTVDIWITKGDKSKLLSQESPIEFTDQTTGNNLITVNELVTYQEMDGFGAAMTGSSAYLLNNVLSSEQREIIMSDLFSTEGIGLNFIRHSIGASDFNLTSYTYADTPDDLDLSEFSIDYDKTDIIPMLQLANEKSMFGIKLLGTPWSAPAWMKDNNYLNGGSLLPSMQNLYAQYISKYIESYKNEGLPIYAITVQNEPGHESDNYPSMTMTEAQQINFVKNDLGPQLAMDNHETKIIIYDHNWNNVNYPITVLNDPEAKNYIAGSAFHAYGGNYLDQVHLHNAHPDKGIWFTEQTGHGWGKIWGNYDYTGDLVWETKNLFIGPIRNYTKGVMFWNLALDKEYGPQNFGCYDCRGVVTIDQSNGDYYKEVEYYVLGHFSKFVQPGAVRIESNEVNKLNTVAFQNPDQSLVLVVCADWGFNGDFTIKHDNKTLTTSLSQGQVATFKWFPTSVTSTKVLENEHSVTASFNNSKTALTIRLRQGEEISQVQLYDMKGHMIVAHKEKVSQTFSLNTPMVINGTYMMRYLSNNSWKSIKINSL